jgi:hypothetical protein
MRTDSSNNTSRVHSPEVSESEDEGDYDAVLGQSSSVDGGTADNRITSGSHVRSYRNFRKS